MNLKNRKEYNSQSIKLKSLGDQRKSAICRHLGIYPDQLILANVNLILITINKGAEPLFNYYRLTSFVLPSTDHLHLGAWGF